MNVFQILEQHILLHQNQYRLAFFLIFFGLMAFWERWSPTRPLRIPRYQRWFSNICLSILNSLALRFFFPFALTGVALFAQQEGWGLFNILRFPFWIEVLAGILLLDLVIYGQHVAAHQWPLFWRFHRVHHADQDFDVTTGARFHTLEILFSFCLKIFVVILLGAPPLAVVVFEIILSSMALFNHSNASLPPTLEKIVRSILVTPDMHRIHHSIKMVETNSNYGFNLSIWDRMFGTYRQEAQAPLEIGLENFQNTHRNHNLWAMLAMPFKR